jgi:hypothetical protein
MLAIKDSNMKNCHHPDNDRRSMPCGKTNQWLLAGWLLLFAMFTTTGVPARASGKPASWKAIEDAVLRVDDGPVKEWNVYQTGKKTDPLVLQMGKRFLMIEVHEKRVFELDPSKIERKSDDNVLWDPSDHPANPLAISDWSSGDNGSAFQITAKLDAEGHVLDLLLPHVFDTQTLPVHAATQRRR